MIIAAIPGADQAIEGFLKVFLSFAASPGFLLFLLLAVAAAWLKSKKGRVKGWTGETVTRVTAIGRLDHGSYRGYHDLYLPRPDGKGTTQIDHVVVSEFGIFVIETKNFSGWIFAGENDRNWTQQHFKKRTSVPNPLHQNKLHTRALRDYLNVPENALVPIVWMPGETVFKTPVPRGVLTTGLRKFITSRTERVLTAAETARINAALENLDRSLERGKVSRAHRAQWDSPRK